jgi:tRNA pseudouridine55 synthase
LIRFFVFVGMFGILNLFKPSGPTSRDCVNRIQRLIKPCKVGHAGTLDPMADGVLLVPIGQAVRLVDWLHHLPKSYEAVFELGKSSLSGDDQIETRPVENATAISQVDWESIVPEFLGEIRQTPPIYSAVKVEGQRAYDRARRGEAVVLPPRTVTIHGLETIRFEYPFVTFRVDCGTGTYIRSLGRDMARRLGSDAVMTKLTRTSIGSFDLGSAIKPESLNSAEQVAANLLDPVIGLSGLRSTLLDENQVRDLVHGKAIRIRDIDSEKEESPAELVGLDSSGRLRSILRKNDDGSWAPFRNFLEP